MNENSVRYMTEIYKGRVVMRYCFDQSFVSGFVEFFSIGVASEKCFKSVLEFQEKIVGYLLFVSKLLFV